MLGHATPVPFDPSGQQQQSVNLSSAETELSIEHEVPICCFDIMISLKSQPLVQTHHSRSIISMNAD